MKRKEKNVEKYSRAPKTFVELTSPKCVTQAAVYARFVILPSHRVILFVYISAVFALPDSNINKRH